jgi:hypothetical protein
VRADRSLIAQVIEEMLRRDSPVQVVFRRTTQAVKLSGSYPCFGRLVGQITTTLVAFLCHCLGDQSWASLLWICRAPAKAHPAGCSFFPR